MQRHEGGGTRALVFFGKSLRARGHGGEGLQGGSRRGGWKGSLWAVGTCGGFKQDGDEETLSVPLT